MKKLRKISKSQKTSRFTLLLDCDQIQNNYEAVFNHRIMFAQNKQQMLHALRVKNFVTLMQ